MNEVEPSEIVVRPARAEDPSWLAVWCEPVNPAANVVGVHRIARLAISRAQLQALVDAAIALDLVEIP